ncbi:thioesterase family protein [Pseudooceanicola atlanticus]|uniref:thioesterase family protein n=1 Tax=Pseudooceanicola atlanticus TaxID=1461694 RepID=UPI00138DF3FB|nr:thioesterase family protein [Pseudooceanicola atlanticus]
MSEEKVPSLGDMVRDLSGQDGRIAAHISPHWMQGRTAFGGITASLALAATRLAQPDLPALRSMQVSFLRPIAEDVTFEVDLIRQGRTSSFVQVDCVSGGKVGARCTFVFGAARESAYAHDYIAPQTVPLPDDCPDLVRRSSGPSFFRNFEAKLADGAQLASGSDRPEMVVWTRLAARDDVDPEIAFICNADNLPPAAMATFTKGAPVSSVTWALDVARMPQDNDWQLTRTTSKHAADGYSVQDMEIRALDGQLLASAQQMVALFA